MTTATNGVKVASVKVTYEFDWEWVTIRNVETGNSMTLDMAGKGLDSRRFRGDWATVWTMLQNTDNGAVISMTASQMKVFKAMCEYTPQSKGTVSRETRAAATVVAHEFKSVDVTTQANAVKGLMKVVEKVNSVGYSLINYDMPKTVQAEKKRLEIEVIHDPSGTCWGHGFMMSESVYVMPSNQFQSEGMVEMLSGWDAYNAHEFRQGKEITYHVLPFAAETEGKIKGMAVRALERRIEGLHASMLQIIANADTALTRAQEELSQMEKDGVTVTAEDVKRIEAKRDNTVRKELRDKAGELRDAYQCAGLFDAMSELEEMLEVLRVAIRRQVVDFNDRVSGSGRKLSDVTV